MNRKINAIIFDADGLMINTEYVAMLAWQQTGREFGYDIPLEVHQQVIGLSIEASEKVMLRIFGDDFPYYELRKRRLEIARAHVQENGMPVKKGVFELLDYLDSLGIPKAVATSSDRDGAKYKLEMAGLFDRFGAVITNDDVQNGKPAPDIFLAAARSIAVNPAECLVLEDSEPGIRGALAAGMLPVMVPDLKPPSPEITQVVHKIFPTLHEVREWLQEVWK